MLLTKSMFVLLDKIRYMIKYEYFPDQIPSEIATPLIRMFYTEKGYKGELKEICYLNYDLTEALEKIAEVRRLGLGDLKAINHIFLYVTLLEDKLAEREIC